jgi:hypothetical protein
VKGGKAENLIGACKVECIGGRPEGRPLHRVLGDEDAGLTRHGRGILRFGLKPGGNNGAPDEQAAGGCMSAEGLRSIDRGIGGIAGLLAVAKRQ